MYMEEQDIENVCVGNLDNIDTKFNQSNEKLKEKNLDIAQQLIAEENITKIKDLTQLFNAAHVKKQVLRSMAYDNLLDHITEQMTQRIIERGDQFSNKDLLDYANSITSSLEKAQKQISGVDNIPLIQINQQNNTVVTEQLSEESQQRVENAIKAILEKLNTVENSNYNFNSQNCDINNELLKEEEIEDENEEN